MYRYRAAWRASRHERIDDDVRAGLARLKQSLGVNPRLGAAALNEAALHLLAAGAAAGKARAEEIDRAKTSLARALSVNANLDLEAKPLSDELAKLMVPGP
jgi:hypothetical protein